MGEKKNRHIGGEANISLVLMGVCELKRRVSKRIRLIVVNFQIRRSDNLLSGPGIQVNAQLPLILGIEGTYVCSAL